MTIRIIYHGHEPDFPATQQHPGAKRYFIYADGRVVGEVDESPAERAQIDGFAVLVRELEDAHGGMTRLVEVRERALSVMSEETPAKEALKRTLQTNRNEHDRMTRELGAAGVKVMPPDQRAFLRRITDRKDRAAFIDATRAERRKIMAAGPLRYAVDVVGAAPTLAEVEAVLKGAA